eukprot:GILK01008047.1.p1 GENE.GILK01008047.1~~GILK01008047.1.p1  ORF type:complete len:167 (-),score=15.63 GILK01008047.1:144-644(-)
MYHFDRECDDELCLPRNFYWAEDGVLAGMGQPTYAANFQALQRLNVGAIVSLTERPIDSISPSDSFSFLHLPIQDYCTPSFEQVDRCLEFIQDQTKAGKAVAVHCRAGKGRTGTMIACCYCGRYDMEPDQAISHVRRLSPGSIETQKQEEFVREYKRYHQKQKEHH